MSLYKQFKEFAVKGNMIDLAIGIIIGAAFTGIVTSLVNDIISPPFGWIMGGIELEQYQWTLAEAEVVDGEVVREAVTIDYGSFIRACINFLFIAVILFFLIRSVNQLKRKAEDPEVKDVPTPKDIQLLTEIRDQLKENSGKGGERK